MIRRLIMVLGVLVLLLVIAALVSWIYIDHLAAAALTSGIEYAGDVKCSVSGVSVSVLSGRIRIKRLAVKSPNGYAEADMFALEDAGLQVRVRSLWDQPVHVRHLEIIKPLLRVEPGPGGSNVRVFLDNVRRKLGAGEKEPDQPPARMWVDKLVIQDATVQIGSRLAERELMDVTLETIELADIRGRNERGVTPGELAAMIVYELVRRSALKGELDFESLIPLDLTKGLQTVLQSTGFVFAGATDVLTAPLGTILKLVVPPGDKREAPPESP